MKLTRKKLDRAILRKLVQGATLPQIARRFGLTLLEVKAYRRRICRKLRLNRPTVLQYSRALGLTVPRAKSR